MMNDRRSVKWEQEASAQDELLSTPAISRRDFLKKAGLAAGATAAGAVGVYGFAFGPHELSIERVDIRLTRLPRALDGFTIAQISDIHFNFFMGEEHLSKVVDAANALRPDFTALTGDFVNAPDFDRGGGLLKAAETALPCGRVLARLKPRLGLAAVLGNHDFYCEPGIVTRHLESSHIPVLRNRAMSVERGGARLWLSGIDDPLHRAQNFERALRGVREGEPVIALVHEPDIADTVCKYPFDLQLSGHSHGGQVRLPVMGAPVLPTMGRKYPMGLRHVGGMPLYTNRGVGTTVVPVRILCPPELTLVTLRAG